VTKPLTCRSFPFRAPERHLGRRGSLRDGALIYAKRSSRTWCRQAIEDDPNELIRIGRDPAIAIDDGGAIHVSYHYHDEFGISQVKYAVSQP